MQVADRPVTQQGMAGPKTATGSGRQVADKTFYLAQLRQKRSELVEVTSQLQVYLRFRICTTAVPGGSLVANCRNHP